MIVGINFNCFVKDIRNYTLDGFDCGNNFKTECLSHTEQLILNLTFVRELLTFCACNLWTNSQFPCMLHDKFVHAN